MQCVLEYTLRPPPFPPLTSESQKRSHFRSLFDSGEPLFGEEKAPGWARWALGGRAEGGSNQGGAGEGETPEPAPETAEDRGGWTGWRDLSEFGGVKEFESMGVNFALLRREEEGRDGDEEILGEGGGIGMRGCWDMQLSDVFGSCVAPFPLPAPSTVACEHRLRHACIHSY